MGSKAHQAFSDNLGDIGALCGIYQATEGIDNESLVKSSDDTIEVVLRSAIVLLITYWEAYIEDITAEAIIVIAENLGDPDALPKGLKKSILGELKKDNNDMASWKLAGNGWKILLLDRLPVLTKDRNWSFNSPKSLPTKKFIETALGISDIRKAWDSEWGSSEQYSEYLDKLVAIRGEIAHRGRLSKKLNRKFVNDSVRFVASLVVLTDQKINAEVNKLSGVPIFEKERGQKYQIGSRLFS
ncbi:HEPN domain-containing protein [Verrucomicrobiales bacterium]|nr:HEPN domain-containing protein [Verrucomicrobiales bacterium]